MHGDVRLTMLDWPRERISSRSELSTVVDRLDKGQAFVVWSLDEIESIEGFYNSLLQRRFDALEVKILNPFLDVNLDEPGAVSLLKALIFQERRTKKNRRAMPSEKPRSQEELAKKGALFFKDPTPRETIERIQLMRLGGASFRKIARELSISSNTAAKYSDGIIPKIDAEEDRPRERKRSEIAQKLKAKEILLPHNLRHILSTFLLAQRSDDTRSNYTADLAEFFAFVQKTLGEEIKAVPDITEAKLSSFLQHLKTRPLKPNTLVKKIAALAAFLTYCMRRGMIDKNPARLLNLPRVDKQTVVTKGFDEKELKDFLARLIQKIKTARTPLKKLTSERNFLLVRVLLATGARITSVLGIRLKDIATKSGVTTLSLKTKRNATPQSLSIDDDTAKVLFRFLNRDKMKKLTGEDFLFFTEAPGSETHLSKKLVLRLVKQTATEAGIKKVLTTHSFRVTFATFSADSGMDIYELKKRMNHRDINQTSAYVRISDKKIKNAWLTSSVSEEEELYK